MKKIILTASWSAVAVYCILTGVFGPTGLKVTAQAKETAVSMHENIDFLEKLNAEYSIEWNALRSDPGLTAVQGRSLGFIAGDEVVVRIALPVKYEAPVFIGERVLYVPSSSLPELGIKAGAFYFWLFILLAGLVRKLLCERKQHVQFRKEGSPGVMHAQREMRVQEASRT